MGVLYTGVKRLACEANRSPLFTTNLNNEWSFTSTISLAFVTYTGLTLNLRSYILKFQNESLYTFYYVNLKLT
jgi:hypothetical protein